MSLKIALTIRKIGKLKWGFKRIFTFKKYILKLCYPRTVVPYWGGGINYPFKVISHLWEGNLKLIM